MEMRNVVAVQSCNFMQTDRQDEVDKEQQENDSGVLIVCLCVEL